MNGSVLVARRQLTTLDLIQRLSQAEAALSGQLFLAPLLRGGRARLRLQGLIYQLQVDNQSPGWWVCRIVDQRRATAEEPALPWQRGDYLVAWPALRLVLIEPMDDQAWLALPYNLSDAAQRFTLVLPMAVQLVEQGQPFERVVGRVEGNTIWYDDHDRRADPTVAETLRAALAEERELPGIVAGLGAGEQAAYQLCLNRMRGTYATAEALWEAQSTINEARQMEQRLRHALAVGGAQLLGYTQTDQGLVVTWERDAQRSVTLVNRQMDILSAGICLSGEDRRFDLTSIVRVVQESPDYARDDGYWFADHT
ncbi:MAG: hypothetical protein HC837_14190 [Chloroflexaceae bacterium]|nr:hypothetical protein [Chloroflexaceae bacterium]